MKEGCDVRIKAVSCFFIATTVSFAVILSRGVRPYLLLGRSLDNVNKGRHTVGFGKVLCLQRRCSLWRESKDVVSMVINNSQYVSDIHHLLCMEWWRCCTHPSYRVMVAYLLDLVVGVKVNDVTKGLLQSCYEFFHDVREREKKVEGKV